MNLDGGTRITEAEVVLRTVLQEREVLHREISAAVDDEAASVVVVVAAAGLVGTGSLKN